MKRARGLSLATLGMVLSPLALAEEPITLKKVKYDELTRFVAGHRGKVVLVDFWGTFCRPCRAAFPHLVSLHQKYQRQGLVVISVSVDDPEDAQAVEQARKFLVQQKATMTNFLLDESAEVWQKKLGSETVPIVFVFNRLGQVEKKYTEIPREAELDGLIEKLLGGRGTR